MIRRTVDRIRKLKLRHRKPRRREDTLIYEGSIYVRPIGRGVVLEDEPGKPHLGEWIEVWLMKSAPHRSMSGNFYARLDIIIKDVSKAPERRLGVSR